jgi:hypothetical protein
MRIRCRGTVFTKSLASNDRRDTNTDKDTGGGEIFVRYAVEMGLGAIICIRFIKISSGIQKLLRGIYWHTDTYTVRWSHKPTFILFYFFEITKVD